MSFTTTRCIWCLVVSLPLALLLATVARGADPAVAEKLPDGITAISATVIPNAIDLTNKFAYRQLLVQGKTADGEDVDLTRLAKISTTGDVVTVSNDGVVRPTKDGSGEVVIEAAGQSFHVPVKVSSYDATPPISFVRDVQPVLSRMGCNQGTCHGSKDGKNGFKLSLRGYDSIYDHRALTDDISGRRFNRANPAQSLMLLKATGSIPHAGGVLTNVGEPYYELVREWVSQGVKLDLDAKRVASIEVLPQNPVLPRAGMKQQMQVLATFQDGTVRDVTREAYIESGNIEVIEAAKTGVVTTLRRGEAPVLVRYEGAYAATTIICMGDRSGYQWEETPVFNYVDEHVYEKLRRMKILPSGLCDDADFVRRVHLDLTGLPPTAEKVADFLADARETRVKRDELVDQLIGSREYVEHWTNKWADLLQVNRKFLGEAGAMALRDWIKQNIAANRPYDQFAADLLTASGSNLENPPAAYWKIIRDPASLMENTTHLFLAVRFNCNKCHDHPFERWTQDQYYQLSAFFAQVGRKEDPEYRNQKIGGSAVEGAMPLVEVIFDQRSGEVTHDRTGQITPPTFPYSHNDVTEESASRRQKLAHWMTSKDNQYFAKSYVNRLWGYLFGSGIIEPIDDIRAGNPATNPALLDHLTQDFVEHNFDMQHMLRTICKSRTYQHAVTSNKWNDDDTINYSHCIPRRLPAEVLFDAIYRATGSGVKLAGVPAGFRAAQLTDAGQSNPFLDDFGKPVRESACECERSSGVVLGPILKLVNGPTVADAIADSNSDLTKLVATEKDDAKLIEQVFLRFLARRPTEAEIKFSLESLQAPPGEVERATAAISDYEKSIPEKLAKWESEVQEATVWTPLTFDDMKSGVGAQFAQGEDQAILVSGPKGKDTYTLGAIVELPRITGVRLEALTDDSLAAKGPGRAKNGNFVLNELKLSAVAKGSDKPADYKFSAAQADFSQESFAVAGAVDGNDGTGWAVSPKFGEAHTALFQLKEPVQNADGSRLTLQFVQQYVDGEHNLGKFRVSVTSSPNPVAASNLPAEIAAVLKVPAAERKPEQQAALLTYYRSLDVELPRLTAELKRAQEQATNARLFGVQDLAWALINSPAFLFNH